MKFVCNVDFLISLSLGSGYSFLKLILVKTKVTSPIRKVIWVGLLTSWGQCNTTILRIFVPFFLYQFQSKPLSVEIFQKSIIFKAPYTQKNNSMNETLTIWDQISFKIGAQQSFLGYRICLFRPDIGKQETGWYTSTVQETS